MTGFALYAGGLLGVALAGGPPLLVGSLLAFGAGSGLVTPTLFAGLSALVPTGLVPEGPASDWSAPHDRARLSETSTAATTDR